MKWKRFSVRRGITQEIGPLDGVPKHLRHELFDFLRMVKTQPGGVERGNLIRVCMRLHIARVRNEDPIDTLLKACSLDKDGNLLLDVIDCLLDLSSQSPGYVRHLNVVFEDCGVNWFAEQPYQNSNGELVPGMLTHRLDPEVRDVMATALDPSDQSGTELRKAWQAVYGRNPDPSDAWDHAIKSVEILLCPIVMPAEKKGQIGKAIGQLKSDTRSHPDKWKVSLPTKEMTYEVTGLIGMLDMLWPNPDRHSNANSISPTQEQAEHVLLLAATLVQWLRSGALQRN